VTAAQLLAALTRAGCRPTIDGPDVVFAADPPGELARPLAVLLTGVRALLMGQRWHGIDPRTGHACGPRPAGGCGPLAFGALDPAAKLPRTVGLCASRPPAKSGTDCRPARRTSSPNSSTRRRDGFS